MSCGMRQEYEWPVTMTHGVLAEPAGAWKLLLKIDHLFTKAISGNIRRVIERHGSILASNFMPR
jgi:hypothetical protein